MTKVKNITSFGIALFLLTACGGTEEKVDTEDTSEGIMDRVENLKSNMNEAKDQFNDAKENMENLKKTYDSATVQLKKAKDDIEHSKEILDEFTKDL